MRIVRWSGRYNPSRYQNPHANRMLRQSICLLVLASMVMDVTPKYRGHFGSPADLEEYGLPGVPGVRQPAPGIIGKVINAIVKIIKTIILTPIGWIASGIRIAVCTLLGILEKILPSGLSSILSPLCPVRPQNFFDPTQRR
ncbi:hypothetical protein GE061_002923 [Apolygus lucorum]|uniref:Uncharacterized protein n=1 Tax=Apolygus lucorum TaxID=248454 RepID=A0A8S9X0M8_APOLU|nr:hypothetical protein GE061_002923 [Apolygus lucorum]